MNTFLVADVGNSRIKWGLCDEHAVLEASALSLDDAKAWDEQSAKWSLKPAQPCFMAGTNPIAAGKFNHWLTGRGTPVTGIDDCRKLPLGIAVDQPEQVGIDRLLNAVAFNAREAGRRQGLIADAGSAVTVDWVDREGVFRGGAIFPGLRLMAQALHQYTAKLPAVFLNDQPGRMPGTNTMAAIQTGIYNAVCGGIRALSLQIVLAAEVQPALYVTGGDSAFLAANLSPPWIHWPHMTLEGLRLTALRLS